jgi:hypothetical protein
LLDVLEISKKPYIHGCSVRAVHELLLTTNSKTTFGLSFGSLNEAFGEGTGWRIVAVGQA